MAQAIPYAAFTTKSGAPRTIMSRMAKTNSSTLLAICTQNCAENAAGRLQRLARSISYAKLPGIAFHQQASSFLLTWPSVLGEFDLAFKKPFLDLGQMR